VTSEGTGSAMRAVVEVVARALVDRPDEVHVTESSRRGMTVVELTTAPGDMNSNADKNCPTNPQGAQTDANGNATAPTVNDKNCGK